jgi:hypothetical protein
MSQDRTKGRLRLWRALAGLAVVAGLYAGSWLGGSRNPEAVAREESQPPITPFRARAPHTGPVPSERPANLTDSIRALSFGRPPAYHPRDPADWQGMRIDVNMLAYCDTTEHCGMARACIGGRCNPCTKDTECAAGEACVLDHCVIASNMKCRTHRDCNPGVLCALTGYTPDGGRNNSKMEALCESEILARAYERAQTETWEPRVPKGGEEPQHHPALWDQDLLRSIRESKP